MFLKAQGDVLIRQVANVPQEAKPVGRDDERVVLAYGEVTGHAHAIKTRAAVPDARWTSIPERRGTRPSSP